ncbi:MAG TPA: hypothetical protein VLV18_01365 [Terriglobales bacterium]|nr:hypothetical protein [Terriglobales bacterium]
MCDDGLLTVLAEVVEFEALLATEAAALPLDVEFEFTLLLV